jgi:hypothetical protein
MEVPGNGATGEVHSASKRVRQATHFLRSNVTCWPVFCRMSIHMTREADPSRARIQAMEASHKPCHIPSDCLIAS